MVLETGFGTGLNFLTTWAAWRQDPQARGQLHYLAVEKHPFPVADLASLHAAWPQLAPLAQALRQAWPLALPGWHRLDLDGGRVWLTLLLGDAARCLNQLSARVDAFFLDGFSPRHNPDMWSPQVLRRLGRLAAPGATLATWCVAGEVRRELATAGFTLARQPGFAGKREMLTGVHPGQTETDAIPHRDRHALILGAGLAGSACAWSLARRGWQVELLERHPGPAQEASGNRAGMVRPLLSLDDNIASRFTRTAFLYAGQTWEQFRAAGLDPGWHAGGALQLARDEVHARHQQAVIAALDFPAGYARAVNGEEADQLARWPVGRGGWYFPGGGWARPAQVCAANLAAAGDGLMARYGVGVARMHWNGQQWQALDSSGRPLAQARVLVVATGSQPLPVAGLEALSLRRVRGQVSHLPASILPNLSLALSRDGYVTPAVDGLVCAGASYDFSDEPTLRQEDHAGNLARLDAILPGSAAGVDPEALSGRVGFRSVAPDRLPLVGALPDLRAPRPDGEMRLEQVPRQAGLYGFLGLASRGLVWAQLGAEVLASRLEGDPAPLELDLMQALDPARFQLRRWRRGR